MWFNLKTEYSFRAVYGHLDIVAEKCSQLGDCAGMADIGNTFGHIKWKRACDKFGIKPIYGVKLPVFEDPDLKERRTANNWMTFIARTQEGLKEIYNLVDSSFQQFYYTQRISYQQVNALSEDVIVLSGVSPRWDLIKRPVYQEVGYHIKKYETNAHKVACIDNYYPNFSDRKIYQCFADGLLRENKSYPLHIPTEREWLSNFPTYGKQALSNLKALSEQCNVELPIAPMVRYNGNESVEQWCKEGSKRLGIKIEGDGEYAKRYKREIDLIIKKEYSDYFLVVADLIKESKTKMVVGPGRGSSAGSLVCYLMGITTIDPIKYDLYFERFIDLNRNDLPDIDIDFQDNKRNLALKYLELKYNSDCVAQLGNISRLKPLSAINRFSGNLNISLDEVSELKETISEREKNGKKTKRLLEEVFSETETGQKFIEEYPEMEDSKETEQHASHFGVHAAGILVCNKPITNYVGVNSRDNRVAMLDKHDAEDINLLKIDALGLRTLTVLADVCDQIGKPYSWLEKIPLYAPKAFKIFNDGRLNGIFQFEGDTIKRLASQMKIENIEDISALCAIGRPGPLDSGGADKYIKARKNENFEYIVDNQIIKDVTKNTYGVIVYQEQVMKIVRELGKFSWEETSKIRKNISKSKGEEYFNQIYSVFEKGAIENGLTAEQSQLVWSNIRTMGSYSFNKSHSVAYSIISYLCAFIKAKYPLEFTVACLNNAKDNRSAIKTLRDSIENDGIEYKWIDKDISMQDWTVKDGILYGGFKAINGIAQKGANKIVKMRKEKKDFPAGIKKKLEDGDSPFRYLYPATQVYGSYYTNPKDHGLNGRVTKITDIPNKNCNITIIGCLLKKILKTANKGANGNNTWLNIVLEDDTEQMLCQVRREDYLRLGKEIAENGKEEKDWYIVNCNKKQDWNILFIKNILRITK